MRSLWKLIKAIILFIIIVYGVSAIVIGLGALNVWMAMHGWSSL